MKDEARRNAARDAANSYAPHPEQSLVMFGLVGGVLATLGLVLFGQFYDVDMTDYPVVGAGLVLSVTVISLVVWLARRRRHGKAYRKEYDKARPD